MALDGIIGSIRKVSADITQNREKDGLRIAFDVLALVKLRVQTSGVNSEGQSFAPYTPFTKRERTKGGYQVGFVDYTQTGRFWASIRPRVEDSSPFAVTIAIGPTDAYGREILDDAEPKRGNLLLASKEEIEIARKFNFERISNYLNQVG